MRTLGKAPAAGCTTESLSCGSNKQRQQRRLGSRYSTQPQLKRTQDVRQRHMGTRPPTGENSALLKGVLSTAAANKIDLPAPWRWPLPVGLIAHLNEKAVSHAYRLRV